jgi:putative flippase GtrA
MNREWSFRDRGGRERHHEALLFFAFSGVGVLLSMAPLWVSSYILDLRVPMVSLTAENIADFISAYLIGNLLQMAFRFWAFRRWVFPDESARSGDKALESALTAGGIAEVFEDVEANGTVTLLGAWLARRNRADQLGDSSDPRVSKTS